MSEWIVIHENFHTKHSVLTAPDEHMPYMIQLQRDRQTDRQTELEKSIFAKIVVRERESANQHRNLINSGDLFRAYLQMTRTYFHESYVLLFAVVLSLATAGHNLYPGKH